MSAERADAAPTANITITAVNPPPEGLYVAVDFTTTGIDFADFVPQSDTQAQVSVWFRPPSQMAVGTYGDTVTVAVCLDDQCTRHVRGSPKTVATTYTVNEITNPSVVSIDKSTIDVTRPTTDGTSPTAVATISVTNPRANGPFVIYNNPTSGVPTVSAVRESGTTTRLHFTFRPASQLNPGTYTDTIVFQVCYDIACILPVTGSPLPVTTSYVVTNDAQPEPGLTPVPILSRAALPHDVIDAEYSQALDAIVMVSSYPRNALYVYDVDTAVETELALNKAPTSVSISPNGLNAAVGHDALVTHVDLTTVGQAGAPAPTLLNVTTGVFDIVLDGRGFVHAFPVSDQWVNVHSVEVATNIETLGGGLLYAGSRAKLHPSGDFIYTANNGLSPSDIAKYDVTNGPATYLYDSPYHGDYGMCGNVWMSEDGVTIYTPCGNTFRSSAVRAQDMIYSGRLQMSTSQFSAFLIRSLSQASETKEIALIEYDAFECMTFGNQQRCYTHLNLYESDFLNRIASYSIPPVAVSGQSYAQRGMFVFHDGSGTRRFMISRLYAMPNPASEYYLTVLQ